MRPPIASLPAAFSRSRLSDITSGRVRTRQSGTLTGLSDEGLIVGCRLLCSLQPPRSTPLRANQLAICSASTNTRRDYSMRRGGYGSSPRVTVVFCSSIANASCWWFAVVACCERGDCVGGVVGACELEAGQVLTRHHRGPERVDVDLACRVHHVGREPAGRRRFISSAVYVPSSLIPFLAKAARNAGAVGGRLGDRKTKFMASCRCNPRAFSRFRVAMQDRLTAAAWFRHGARVARSD